MVHRKWASNTLGDERNVDRLLLGHLLLVRGHNVVENAVVSVKQ